MGSIIDKRKNMRKFKKGKNEEKDMNKNRVENGRRGEKGRGRR